MFSRFNRISVCDRQTDRQTDTDILPQHSSCYAYVSCSKNIKHQQTKWLMAIYDHTVTTLVNMLQLNQFKLSM